MDDDRPIAIGSRTQHHTLWNSLQNAEDLDDFFDRIYEQSWSHRMRPTVDSDTTLPHDYCIRLLGAKEFPLWCIGCRVCL